MVKNALERAKMIDMNSIVDLKMRSKLFLSYSEACLQAINDFTKKLPGFYPGSEDEHSITRIQLINPSFSATPEVLLMQKGSNLIKEWDANCASTIFFFERNLEEDAGEEEGEESLKITEPWILKYEIRFTEDAIETTKNGEHLFIPTQGTNPKTNFTSSYH